MFQENDCLPLKLHSFPFVGVHHVALVSSYLTTTSQDVVNPTSYAEEENVEMALSPLLDDNPAHMAAFSTNQNTTSTCSLSNNIWVKLEPCNTGEVIMFHIQICKQSAKDKGKK